MSEAAIQETAQDASAAKAARKPSKKSTIISLAIISVTAIGLGLGAGFFLHSQLAGGETTDYGTLNTTTLADDNSTLLKTYASIKKAGGDYLSAFSKKPYQAANIALQLYAAHDHCFAQGKGVGKAVAMGIAVNQEIRSTVIKNGSKYFEESLSLSSAVNLADRMYQEGDTVTRHEGTVEKGNVEVPSSFSKTTDYSLADYAEAMGRDLDNPCIYIISSKTTYLDTTATSGVPTSFKQNDSGGYTLELELNKVYAVVNYVKQMKTISSLASKPSFKYVHLTFELDKDLNPISMTSHEYYWAAVSAAVGSYVEGTLTTTYQTDGDYTIPELMTPITYSQD
jgi:preprotein translocase subunit Sss1